MIEEQEPAYRRIAGELRRAILAGELAEGDRLPSRQEIMRRYEVASATATRVFDVLRAEGLIVARAKSGYYVRRFVRIVRSSPGRLAREQWGTGQAIQDHDTDPRPRTVDVVVGDVPAPAYVARALGVDPTAPVLSRSRRFVVDERPVQLATSYLPVELTRGTRIEHTDTGLGGTYARLAELGYAPTHFTERVLDRMPTEDEAADLDLDLDGSRVFEITRYAYVGDRCVEVNRMVLDAAAYELVYTFPA